MSTQGRSERTLNRSMLIKPVVVAFLMFGFGFTLVPMYRVIGQVTGVNDLVQRDTTQREARNTQVDMSRKLSVEFDANARGLLAFKPEQASRDVHPGELMTAMYDLSNNEGRTVTTRSAQREGA